MNQPEKRRSLLLPLLLSSGVLSTGGAGAWHYLYNSDSADVAQTTDGDTLQPGPLSQAVEDWAAGSEKSQQPLTPPSAPDQMRPLAGSGEQAGAGVEQQGDPFLRLAADTIARGQSPSRPVASSEPSVGNPLRGAAPAGRYETVSAEDARQAFGEMLASESVAPSAPPNPIRVAEADPHMMPAAFRDEHEASPATATPIPSNATPLPAPAAQTSPRGLPDAFGQHDLSPPAPIELQSPPAAPLAAVEENPYRPLPSTPAASPAPGPAPAPLTLESPQPVAPVEPPTSSVLIERTNLPPTPQTFAAEPAPAGVSAEPDRFAPGPSSAPMSLAMSSSDPVAGPPTSGRPGERAMEGRQQPSLAIQKFAPEEIQVGKPCKFIVKVRNVGQRPAVGVVVRDQTPSGARLMATTPRAATDAGGEIQWDLGTLSPGEERSLEMELTPIEEGEIGSVATVSFAAHASAKSRCTRPQLAIRMTAPSRVLVGKQQRVKIELRNPGTGDATGVMLLENVPENLRHEAGAALEFEVGTLRAGETRTMELVMNAEKAGRVVNTLTARADGNLEVEQQVEFEVVAPELAVGLEGPKRRYLERPATYTVRIDNPGTAAAKDVRLVTRLPQGMRFVKANNYGEYDASTHSVYWALSELPEGEGGEVQLTALPVTSGELTLQVEGQASEGLKDETALAVKIEGLAALNFEVLDVEDPIEVGGETMYEVRVNNQGTKAASNVVVRFVTPQGMRAVAASGETRHTLQNGAVTFAPLERLAPQGEAMYRVRVEGVQPGDQRLTVEVSSDDLRQPVRKEESTRVFGDE